MIDPESQNKLINDSFIQTLPTAEDMNELCAHHEGDNPHDIIAEEVASGQLKRFKHIVKRCQQLDKTYHGRAIKAKVVGASGSCILVPCICKEEEEGTKWHLSSRAGGSGRC